MKLNRKSSLLFIVSTLCFIAGCAQNLSPNEYLSGQVGVVNHVVKAKIISMRRVRVDNSSGVGGLAGTGAGAIAGSAVGQGGGSILVAIGGAVIGGVVGEFADKAVHKKLGTEYILQVTKTGKMISVTQVESLSLHVSERVLVVYGKRTRLIPDSSYHKHLYREHMHKAKGKSGKQ